MERAELHAEFHRLNAINDLDRLKAILPLIEDTDPFAAQMLNCIGYGLGVRATNYADLDRAAVLLRRAAPLAQEPVLRAKVLTNLMAFYNLGNSHRKAIAMAETIWHIDLEPADQWLYGMVQYMVGAAYARLREFTEAERALNKVLRLPATPMVMAKALVALATMAARRGDAALVARYLDQVDEPRFIPHLTAVRARLALTLGFAVTAKELAIQAASALSATEPRAANWNEQLEAWALYHEASLAAGDVQRAESIQRILIELNGGTGYRSSWR